MKFYLIVYEGSCEGKDKYYYTIRGEGCHNVSPMAKEIFRVVGDEDWSKLMKLALVRAEMKGIVVEDLKRDLGV